MLNIQNLFLISALIHSLPFCEALRRVFTLIPCPTVPAVISNLALAGVLGFLIVFAMTAYPNPWTMFVFLAMVWLWLVLGTMIARLYIQRDEEHNHLSPLIHIPLIGLSGAASNICVITALPLITISDFILLYSLDSLTSGIFHFVFFNSSRRQLIRSYCVLIALVAIYFSDGSGFNSGHSADALVPVEKCRKPMLPY
jgi:hypothetical protein